MELKLNRGESVMIIIPLLIVPYGIETTVMRGFAIHTIKLLIVPYGIET